MRITHVVCTPSFAGVERHIAVLAAAQHDAGHEVTVLGGDQAPMRAAISRSGVRLLPAPDRTTTLRHLAGAAGRRADVVATHMTEADLTALASPTLARTPIVSTRHFAARRGSTRAARAVAERFQQRLAAEIAVSEYIAGTIDVDAVVIPPGVPIRPDGQPPSTRDRTVLVAQRLEAEKATEVAVSAFAESGLHERGWRLVIAGDGSLRVELEMLARRLGIREVTDFVGHRHDVDLLMARAGILLAPCPVEGMGLTVIEAMACGTPVVAAAAGGHLENVGGVADAALFASGDAVMAGRLLADLAFDPARHDRYGQALRERQRRAFSVAAQAESTESLYRHVMASRSPREPRPGHGQDLVVISLEPWDRVWRRNQHLLTGLLRADPSLRVLFVEPARDPLHSMWIGHSPRTGRGLRRGPHLPGVAPDALWLLEPTKALPRRIDTHQDERWAAAIRRACERLGFTRPVLWVNDPQGALVMQRTGWPTLYDITDDWLEADRGSTTLSRLASHEATLLDQAVEVVVCSRALAATKSSRRPVTLVHNAVDIDATARPTARPEDLPVGPVAIYVGTLHSDRLDIDLCVQTASALAGRGTVALVGPDALTRAEQDRLDAAGVARLGAKDRRLVPGYLQHADALLVPHVVDDFTDSLDPIKLYEYRAVGRPVISTPVAGFREAADGRLRVVDPGDFPATVAAALPASDRYPAGVDHGVPTWTDRVREMQTVLDRVRHRGDARASNATTDLPLAVRVRLGHAAAQHLAARHDLDVLHIKGDSLDERLVHEGRRASDADVLVRPAHLERFLAVCAGAGYRTTSRFATGSPFEHSTTLWHDLWGYLDVHRHYPGIGLSPAEAFDRLWSARVERAIAGVTCPTPDIPAQVGFLVLHAGRSLPDGQATADVSHAWDGAHVELRQAVRAWVGEFRADVAFAAGTGQLADLPPSSEKDLWLAVTREGRLQEWRARIAAAPDLATRARLLARLPVVNTDHLATRLGHRPNRREIAREFLDRARRAVAEYRGRR
ncbi:glycosyltransferase family 4 protein [Janibacter cremeus]|uniref:Glycosyltransferase involved in cell wall biosynthesis n=1 Tax=Janibacter cremeus TaxID=1285192 RepID=A0A852W033_9MICO|nr:glycosyltransferase [Janibacter cremeus]NYF99041.1 glycosyltransferase involved in cell wall biosynthesis [Janibacter cremeus]